jgi:hypothetical protein
MSSNAIIKGYMYFGLTYGVCRSIYYYDKMYDTTYTSEGVKIHPLTIPMFTAMTISQGLMAGTFWPIFMGVDVSNYQKTKWGIREKIPPFPFDSFKWRDEK